MLEVLPVSARVENGVLTLGEVSASELADRFGTPLVVYCDETLRQQARALLAAAEPDGRVFYGTKAFANVAALRILREEGIGADVASTGELAFARAAGFAGADLVVHGNNKDEALLRGAAGEGAPIVLDAPDEAELAAAAGVARVLARVTLGVDADTHEAVVTGHHGSKFGLPPEEARSLVADALERRHVRECLRPVEEAAVPPGRGDQRARLPTERLLAVDDERRPEPLRELGGPYPTQHELTVLHSGGQGKDAEHRWILPGTVFGSCGSFLHRPGDERGGRRERSRGASRAEAFLCPGTNE